MQQDKDLALFLDPTKAAAPITKEIERTQRAITWLDSNWDKDEHGFGAEVDMSHGVVRYLKSVALSFLTVLRARRDDVAQRISATAVLDEVDRRIARAAEILDLGVFGRATPLPLLVVDRGPSPSGPAKERKAPRQPPPVAVGTIDILDSELKERCLDLFGAFTHAEQPDRFDTVVMEAVRV